MNATPPPLVELTAADLMSALVPIVNQSAAYEQVAKLLRDDTSLVLVVDDQGRYLGELSAVNLLRWVEEPAEDRPRSTRSCRYQVRGRLLTGGTAVICTLAEGSCPLQAMQPTIGGGHVAVCRMPYGVLADWQQTHDAPASVAGEYLSADAVIVERDTPLLTLVAKLSEAQAHHAVVVDEDGRPLGVVAVEAVLAALAPRPPEFTG
jgi:CBS-domain-containing membrane protein